MSYTTEDLIRRVRAKTQEKNSANITDQTILDALNGGQDYAFDLMARHYSEPLKIKDPDTITLDSEDQFTMRESSFEDRLCNLDVRTSANGRWIPLTAITSAELNKVEYTTGYAIPKYYMVIGRKVQIIPHPQVGCEYRAFYLRDVEPLVLPQGRITGVQPIVEGSVDHAYVTVDEVGSDLSVSDNYGKYVNIIDSQTGEVKNTLQLTSIDPDSNALTFKITPTRTEVLNKTIDTDLDSSVQIDDYVCGVDGTCIPYFKKPLSNFIVQYATLEIRRGLGYDISLEERKLEKLEIQVERTWAKRESTLRITPNNRIWR